jgi:hypothetical protein
MTDTTERIEQFRADRLAAAQGNGDRRYPVG